MPPIPQIPVDWAAALNHTDQPFTISIVIIYNDLPAALRAAQMVERLGQKFKGRMQPRLQPLPLAQLSDPNRYDRSLSDAASAQMIIVSINGPGGLPPLLKGWIHDCTAQKSGGNSTVVALLGSMDEAEDPDSAQFQLHVKGVRKAGLDFFTPRDPQKIAGQSSSAFEIVG